MRLISTLFRRLRQRPTLDQLARIDRHVNLELRRARLGI